MAPYGGPKTAGPAFIPDQQSTVALVDIAWDVLTKGVLVYEAAKLVRAVLAKAAEVSANEVLILDEIAVVLAWEAIGDAGFHDVTLAFEVPLSQYTKGLPDFSPTEDGYLVGFRTGTSLHIVHVSATGEVTITRESVSVSWPKPTADRKRFNWK